MRRAEKKAQKGRKTSERQSKEKKKKTKKKRYSRDLTAEPHEQKKVLHFFFFLVSHPNFSVRTSCQHRLIDAEHA